MQNKYEIEGDMVSIFLENASGYKCKTIIDLDELPKVIEKDYKWFPEWNKDTRSYYVKVTVYNGIIDGKVKYKNIRLHRFIMDAKNAEVIDHINHDTLDNRKSNLRRSDMSKNAINRHGVNRNSSTGVRNVSYNKKDNKYVVQLQVNRKNTCFGRFNTLEEAKEIADIKRKEIYGI